MRVYSTCTVQVWGYFITCYYPEKNARTGQNESKVDYDTLNNLTNSFLDWVVDHMIFFYCTSTVQVVLMMRADADESSLMSWWADALMLMMCPFDSRVGELPGVWKLFCFFCEPLKRWHQRTVEQWIYTIGSNNTFRIMRPMADVEGGEKRDISRWRAARFEVNRHECWLLEECLLLGQKKKKIK